LPKNVIESKKKFAAMNGTPCLKRPDLDNCIKAVSDGLESVAFEQDSCIYKIYPSKIWGVEGYSDVTISWDDKKLEEIVKW